jgi:NAD(P)-dependent dehydrogenase (short-subunit alcohol dehydrogenase family)
MLFERTLRRRKAASLMLDRCIPFFGAPHAPAYAAAKSAIVSLTKSLAIAFAQDKIRVNAIAPGWIKTEISRAGRENPEFNAKVVARIPNGEWAEPGDLAGTAIFLASSASSLINGVTIPVDGGYCAT